MHTSSGLPFSSRTDMKRSCPEGTFRLYSDKRFLELLIHRLESAPCRGCKYICSEQTNKPWAVSLHLTIGNLICTTMRLFSEQHLPPPLNLLCTIAYWSRSWVKDRDQSADLDGRIPVEEIAPFNNAWSNLRGLLVLDRANHSSSRLRRQSVRFEHRASLQILRLT